MSIKGFEVGGVQQQYDYTALDNIPANLVQDANYVHTDNNYTNADKTKLSGIEAQANKTTIDATLTHSGQAADAKATGDEINDLKSAINDPVTGLATKAPVIIDTASGAIASFEDGADGMPIKELTVSVEPAQDLHGYDAPWPAGGGKNKLPNCEAATKTSGGITVVSDGTGKFTVSGTATGPVTIIFPMITPYVIPTAVSNGGTGCLHIMNSIQNNDITLQLLNNNTTVDVWTFTIENRVASSYVSMAGNTINKIGVGVVAGTYNFTFAPMFTEDGSTSATDFAPYSNICPISGWTGANVTRTGRNLLSASDFLNKASKRRCTATVTNDIITVTCTEAGQVWVGSSNAVVGNSLANDYALYVNGGETITASTKNGSPVAAYLFIEANENKVVTKITDASATATLRSDTKYVAVRVTIGDSMALGAVWTDAIQIEISSTATAYEPYNADTYSITFPSSAGTVYGGTLDVTQGKLTVDRAKKSGMTRGSKDTSNKLYKIAELSDAQVWTETSSVPPIISTALTALGLEPARRSESPCITQYGKMFYAGGYIGKESELDALLQSLEFVYELATPIVYNLTPTEVTTLLGTNNIFADCGDTTVNYYADTTLFVNKKIAAAVAALS